MIQKFDGILSVKTDSSNFQKVTVLKMQQSAFDLCLFEYAAQINDICAHVILSSCFFKSLKFINTALHDNYITGSDDIVKYYSFFDANTNITSRVREYNDDCSKYHDL